MKAKRTAAKDIDEYIAGFPPEVQERLQRIRATIHKAAPAAQEAISYQIPAFKLHGNLIFFAAYQKHIGLYPRPRGNAELTKALAANAGGKGTIQFPLDKPISLSLITKIVKARIQENRAKAAKRKSK